MTRHPPLERLLELERAGAAPERDTRDLDHLDHLAECHPCRDRIRFIREARSAAAEVLTPPAPDGGWSAIEARLDSGDAVILPSSRRARRGRGRLRGLPRWAAAALLIVGFGGVAALTVPELARWIGERGNGVVEMAPGATPDAPSSAGIAVPASGEELVVRLVEPGPTLLVRVAVEPTELFEVRGTGAAAEAEFATSSSGVEVRGATAGVLRIRAPVDSRLRLDLDGRTVLTRDDDGFHVAGGPTIPGDALELRLPTGGGR